MATATINERVIRGAKYDTQNLLSIHENEKLSTIVLESPESRLLFHKYDSENEFLKETIAHAQVGLMSTQMR